MSPARIQPLLLRMLSGLPGCLPQFISAGSLGVFLLLILINGPRVQAATPAGVPAPAPSPATAPAAAATPAPAVAPPLVAPGLPDASFSVIRVFGALVLVLGL